MNIHRPSTHINRALLIFMISCLIIVGLACQILSLLPVQNQLPLPFLSTAKTPKKCFWSGEVLTWNDSNSNGIREADEPFLGSVRIFSEDRSTNSGKLDLGYTGSNGSMIVNTLLPGCTNIKYEIFPEVPQNCQLTTRARLLVNTRKDDEKFSFGFLCR